MKSVFFIPMILALSLSARAQTTTVDLCEDMFSHHPDSYAWLDGKGQRVRDFTRLQNGLIFNDLRNMNVKGVGALVRSIYDKPQTSFSFQLRNNSTLSLYNQGVSKPKEVVLTRKDGAREVLFHTFQWSRKGTFNIVDMSLSPDERYVSATVAENGTIDDFRVIVYDIQTRTILSDKLQTKHETMVAWIANSKFILSDENGYSTYELQNNKIKRIEKVVGHTDPGTDESTGIMASESGVTLVASGDKVIVYQVGKPTMQISNKNIEAVSALIGNDIYLLDKGDNEWGQILKLTRDSKGQPEVSVVLPESNWVTAMANKLDDSHLAVYRYLGPDQSVSIFNVQTGNIEETIQIPKSSSMARVSWAVPGKQLTMTLTGPIVARKDFIYDFASKSFIGGDPEKDMMTLGGVEYKTDYIFARSDDGAQIPTRIVRRIDAPQDGSAPGLIKVYGGFDSLGYLLPSFNALDLEYLKRGGALVLPGVRGGSEYGKAWHEKGMLSLKQNGLNDVKAAARMAQGLGYIARDKTVLTGWSNGGMVTTTVGLQSPELFRLIVTGAGVDDFLDTQKNDSRYQGWMSEYGDAYGTDRKYMMLTDPISLAKSGHGAGTQILFVDGSHDSRVNPSNSRKITYAAQKHLPDPSKIRLISLNNAGHWMTSFAYQDVLAWWSNSAVWAAIYDVSGMKP